MRKILVIDDELSKTDESKAFERKYACEAYRYMFAKDKSGFYGVYCLYFTAKATQDNLAKLRTSTGRHDGSVDKDVSSMVTSVTSGELSDHHSSVIDSYAGSQGGSSSSSIDRGHSVMGGRSGGKKEEGETEEPKKEEDDTLDIF